MYKWHLEKANNKFKCPNCGAEKRFKRYVYEHNGEYIDDLVGKCDRIGSCGYHYTPKEFFQDNNIDPNSKIPANYKTITPIKTLPKRKINTMDKSLIVILMSTDSHFVKFLTTIFNQEQIDQLQEKYFMGALNKDVIFWQVDEKMELRAGKLMKYNPTTGRRAKTEHGTYWLHNLEQYNKDLPKDWKIAQCLFGEHLLAIYPLKPICLVESEKTAIIASVYFSEYNWLSTGGASQFTKERCQSLKGKTIELFPDLGMFDTWKIKATEIEKELNCKFHLNTFLEESATPEQREQGLDIADILLDNKIEINELITM